MRRTDCAEALKQCVSTNICVLSRNGFIFFLLEFFRVNWIPTSFSLVSTVVRAERMALHIRCCFSFCIDYMHVPYKNEDKLTTLYLQAS